MKGHHRGTVTVAVAIGVAASAVPIAGAATRAGVVGSPTIVSVKETDFMIGLNHGTVKAGRITFAVTDRGKAPHELVVLRTTINASSLSRSPGNRRAVEVGRLGESGDVRPGASRSFTLSLKPGHYALICNLTGHYAAGMFADFTVSG